MSSSSSAARPNLWPSIGRLVIGLLIGVAAFWGAARNLNPRRILVSAGEVAPAWIAISLICVLVVAVLKAVRWGTLYGKRSTRPPLTGLFATLVAAQMVNLVIPLRVGELARIGFMKQGGWPAAVTLSTIIAEKTLDLIAAGLVAAALLALASAPIWLCQPAASLLILGVTVGLGLALAWKIRRYLGHLLTRLLAPLQWVSEKWQRRLVDLLQTMLDALGVLANRRSLGEIALWTVLIWLFSLLTIVALFAAFNLHLPAAAAVTLMLAISFSNIAPSPPVLVGLMQGITVLVLSQFGVDRGTALAVGIWLNIVTVAPLIILGCWGLWSRVSVVLALFQQHPAEQALDA